MARDTLTGSRIRERRTMAGIRQAELARSVGISASYLNLIEHNRRRIGGKLLVDIAQALEVEPSLLSEGAEAALIATLREAAADAAQTPAPELERIDEFAGRFPGWAGLVAEHHSRIESLERTAATLTDRLTHDPHLAASMHEVLSMVTAIRSTAGILADTKEIEPEWRNRFHRNLNEDSQRLAESSQRLVAYLDGAGDAGASLTSPQEEVEALLVDHQYHFPELEGAANDIEGIVDDSPQLTTAAARSMATQALERLAADADALPRDALLTKLDEIGIAPGALARHFDVPIAAVFRRLATLPADDMPSPVGLVMCDISGLILLRKPIDGFPLPRFSAACPKWPLFQTLTRPARPIKRQVQATGRDALRFDCYAVCEPAGRVDFDVDPLLHAYMLIVPATVDEEAPLEVGPTCRVCASLSCNGRREPSVLVEGI